MRTAVFLIALTAATAAAGEDYSTEDGCVYEAAGQITQSKAWATRLPDFHIRNLETAPDYLHDQVAEIAEQYRKIGDAYAELAPMLFKLCGSYTD